MATILVIIFINHYITIHIFFNITVAPHTNLGNLIFGDRNQTGAAAGTAGVNYYGYAAGTQPVDPNAYYNNFYQYV